MLSLLSRSVIRPINQVKTPTNYSKRFYKIQANQLRVGTVIEKAPKKYVEITSVHSTQGAQRGSNIRCDLRDIRTGQKYNEKWRSSEMVEVVEMENKKLEFIESEDNKTFLFRDPIDYDDYNFDAKFVKDLIKWMNPGAIVTVRIINGDPSSIRFKKSIQMTRVAETKDIVDKSDGNTRKPALLENGENIRVPGYIVSGDYIKVNVETKEFVKKIDPSEIDEDEDDDE